MKFALGLWIAPDRSIGINGGINTYAYVEGNPIAGGDPLGLFGPVSGIGSGVFELGVQLYQNNGDFPRVMVAIRYAIAYRHLGILT